MRKWSLQFPLQDSTDQMRDIPVAWSTLAYQLEASGLQLGASCQPEITTRVVRTFAPRLTANIQYYIDHI